MTILLMPHPRSALSWDGGMRAGTGDVVTHMAGLLGRRAASQLGVLIARLESSASASSSSISSGPCNLPRWLAYIRRSIVPTYQIADLSPTIALQNSVVTLIYLKLGSCDGMSSGYTWGPRHRWKVYILHWLPCDGRQCVRWDVLLPQCLSILSTVQDPRRLSLAIVYPIKECTGSSSRLWHQQQSKTTLECWHYRSCGSWEDHSDCSHHQSPCRDRKVQGCSFWSDW